MNLIFGTKDGGFRLAFFDKSRKHHEFTIKKENLEKNLKQALKKAYKYGNFERVLYSSSMDFPEENNVSYKDVEQFEKTLKKIFKNE